MFGRSNWNVTAAPDEVPTMAEECLAVIAQYDPAQRLKGSIFFYDENHGYIGECVLSYRRYDANSAYSPQGSCTAFNRISEIRTVEPQLAELNSKALRDET